MQNVSDSWKAAQKELLVPESFVEITINVSDPDATSDASAASNGEMDYSDVSETVKEIRKNPKKYATLERNIWVLDESCVLLEDGPPYGHNGYIGNVLSNDDGTFSVKPVINISFSEVFDRIIPGITITWATAYEEWAEEFSVTAYNGDEIVAKQDVRGNRSVSSVVAMDIENYNKIEIVVHKWCLPRRRARIKSLIVGVEKTYAKADLIHYTHTMSVDPLSTSLPKSEITFEIVNLNGEYNPDNPQGAEKYLTERQMVTARYGYKLNGEIEWISAGTFFMSEWETPQNGITATFTARDSLEYMSDEYSGPASGTLMEIAEAAMEQAGLPRLRDGTVRWRIDSSLADITAPESVDLSSNSIMEVLQYVSNAACCVFYQDREGVLHIEALPSGETDYVIDQFVSYSNSEISLTKQLKAVDVNDGQYIFSAGTVGDTLKIDNPLVSDGRAESVAKWVAEYLKKRKILSGNFRADPRMDALDRITNVNQFSRTTVLVTEVTYTYNGAFRGTYDGKSEA